MVSFFSSVEPVYKKTKMDKIYISIGKRVPKTTENKLGWKRADFIDENEVCVLVLGGSGTENAELANGYTKIISHTLKANNLREKVGLYSIIYRSDAHGDDYFLPYLLQKKSRESFLVKHHRTKKAPIPNWEKIAVHQLQESKLPTDDLNKEIDDPEYIARLFEKVLLYRISDGHKRLSFDEAALRIRRLNIVAHCHGAFVFLKLEEMMQKKMQELGYTKDEMCAIQKQLLCVAHSPFAPLGISKSTMISFGSAADETLWHQNNFHEELKGLAQKENIGFCYFPDKKGDLFIVSSITKDKNPDKEHTLTDYLTDENVLTREGRLLISFENNVLLNGVRSSLEGRFLPDTQELICANNPKTAKFFEQAKQNGALLYKRIRDIIALRLKMLHAKQL